MSKENDLFNFKNTPNIRNVEKVTSNAIDINNPKISIITAYYNASKYINETAASIFKQTFPYFEWIIINDGSTEENTDSVLADLKKIDNRIRIINIDNHGPAYARYFAAKEAKSDILFFLDADDMIDNTLLECGYFTLLTNKGATWAYSNIVAFDSKEYLWNPVFDSEVEKNTNLVSINSFIRKEKFLEIEEYSNLPKEVHEDYFLWLSFIKKGYYPVRMNYYGFWYRIHDDNRLASINVSEEKSKTAESYIEKARNEINEEVTAIQYPRENNNSMEYPYTFGFDKTLGKGSKHILFLVPWLVFGGADNFNLNLAKGLKKRGYKITIILTEPSEYVLRSAFEEYADEIFDLTTFLNEEDWAAFIHYIIYSRKIDLCFQSNSIYGYHIIPWLKHKFPKIPFVDFLHAEQWEWRNGGYPRDSIAISNFLDTTYVCSKNLENILYNDMNKIRKNTRVIYIGIDSEYFNPNIVEDNLSEKYKERKVILFPCRLAYIKRPILMLNILNKLKDIYEDILVIVVGDGPAYNDMIEYVNKHRLDKYIEFVGYHKDIRPYYKIADVTLICSLSEGISLTTYESLSMGVPVVSSDVGGQKEVINDGVGAIVKNYQSRKFDEYNFNYSEEEINEYVKVINEILQSKNNVKEKCRERIISKFSSIDMTNKLIDDFDELIKKGSSIDSKYLNNIEFAERFLVNFTEKEQIQRNEKKLYEVIDKRNMELNISNKKITCLENEIKSLNNEIDNKSLELVSIKSSRGYKVYKKISDILHKK